MALTAVQPPPPEEDAEGMDEEPMEAAREARFMVLVAALKGAGGAGGVRGGLRHRGMGEGAGGKCGGWAGGRGRAAGGTSGGNSRWRRRRRPRRGGADRREHSAQCPTPPPVPVYLPGAPAEQQSWGAGAGGTPSSGRASGSPRCSGPCGPRASPPPPTPLPFKGVARAGQLASHRGAIAIRAPHTSTAPMATPGAVEAVKSVVGGEAGGSRRWERGQPHWWGGRPRVGAAAIGGGRAAGVRAAVSLEGSKHDRGSRRRVEECGRRWGVDGGRAVVGRVGLQPRHAGGGGPRRVAGWPTTAWPAAGGSWLPPVWFVTEGGRQRGEDTSGGRRAVDVAQRPGVVRVVVGNETGEAGVVREATL